MTKKITIALLSALLVACQAPQQNTPGQTTNVEKPKTTAFKAGTNAPVYGIDVSSFQGDEVDFLNKKTDTLTFIICKATEGITITDPDFANNWKMIQEKGFVRGAYHFYHCQDAPVPQAAHFLAVANSISKTDLPPIVDFEEGGLDGKTNVTQIQSNLLAFLNEIQKQTGRLPILYSDLNMSQTYLNNASFTRYPLYIADYNGQSRPQVPATWQTASWTFWQKSDNVTIDGIQDDFDKFNGNADSLKKFIQTH